MYRARWNFIFASALSSRFLFIVVGVAVLGGIYSAWISSAGQTSLARERNGSVVSELEDASIHGRIEMGFEADKGETDRAVDFLARGSGDTPIKTAAVVTWRGGPDHRWSNPVNWEGSRVPGTSDVARFAASSSSEVMVDADSSGTVAGLILEPDYHGTLSLGRDLTIADDLVLGGGTIDQGNYRLSISHYRQTGGTFTGGDASLVIKHETTLSGGTLLTSKSMTAQSLTIKSPAVVTMAANSKLNLTGDGEPLNGNGLLDVRTNGPNSLEYTGRATSDVTTAGPLRGALGAAVSAPSVLPTATGGSNQQLGIDPVRSRIDPSVLGLKRLEPSRAFGNKGDVRSQKTSLISSLSPQHPSLPLSSSFSRSAALKLTQLDPEWGGDRSRQRFCLLRHWDVGGPGCCREGPSFGLHPRRRARSEWSRR